MLVSILEATGHFTNDNFANEISPSNERTNGNESGCEGNQTIGMKVPNKNAHAHVPTR